MILISVEVPSSNKRLVFSRILFTDNLQEVVFEKGKKPGKSSQQRKEICLRTPGLPTTVKRRF